MKVLPLKRLHQAKSRRPRLAAFDLETNNLSGEILSVCWRIEGESEATLSTNPQDLIDAILAPSRQRKLIWYAHNAGEFDLKHLLPFLVETGIPINEIPQGKLGRCIGFVLHAGRRKIELRDSYALCPMKLSAMTAAYCPELPKLEGAIDFENGEVFDIRNAEHRAYALRDVDSLLSAITRLWEANWQVFGCWPKWTSGSSAMRAWQQTLDKDFIMWPLPTRAEAMARYAYYGGYAPIRQRGVFHNVSSYDFNRMYPSVMRGNEFPYGLSEGTSEYMEGKLGVYRVKVKAPTDPDALTIIPKRIETGVVWARGEFVTTITSVEIEYGRKHGYEFQVLDGFYWNQTVRPFDKFVDICEAYSREHVGDAIGMQVKLTGNSLYGKFGSKRERADLLISQDEASALADGYTPMIDGQTGKIVPFVFCKPGTINQPYIQPHWAAFITAYARQRLHSMMVDIGVERLIYGDTDSMHLKGAIDESKLPMHPSAYGSLKVERFATLEIDAPKSYKTIPLEITDKTPVVIHSKGVPGRVRTLAAWEARNTLDNDGKRFTVHWEGLRSMRVALSHANGLRAVPVAYKRAFSDLANSKSWIVLPGGKVRARELHESAPDP